MKAMILAAGFGTRLHPLTDKRPKALMPVANRPILAWCVDYLRNYGCSDIILNAHHHHDQVVEYVRQHPPHGVKTEVRVEPEILGTGGGIKNVEDFFGREPFAVMNVDILTDIDLEEAIHRHVSSGALVTLVLHDCLPFNQIEADNDLNITDIGKTAHAGRMAFTGIHILDPRMLAMIPAGGFSDIVTSYRNLIRDGEPIKAYVSRNHYWRDIGSVTQYMEANRDFAARPFLVGSDCRVHPSASMEDWAVIGDGCSIGEGATVRRSVLWEGVEVKAGVRISDSVVAACAKVTTDLNGDILLP